MPSPPMARPPAWPHGLAEAEEMRDWHVLSGDIREGRQHWSRTCEIYQGTWRAHALDHGQVRQWGCQAEEAGYPDFVPDACLINRYAPGARLSLHQDKNERDLANPIVSVSLGLPATFQFGGLKRTDPMRRYTLRHVDIAVWGGPSRLHYHGVLELKDGVHDRLGRMRINLTFRGAL